MDINEIKRSRSLLTGGVSGEKTLWLIAEHDRLTAELTAAKESIGCLSKDRRECWQNWQNTIVRAEAAESALAAERKEVERMRGYLQAIKTNEGKLFLASESGRLADEALQPQQEAK